jgi:hypothetical protein
MRWPVAQPACLKLSLSSSAKNQKNKLDFFRGLRFLPEADLASDLQKSATHKEIG